MGGHETDLQKRRISSFSFSVGRAHLLNLKRHVHWLFWSILRIGNYAGVSFRCQHIFAINPYSDTERMVNWNDLKVHVDPRWRNTFRGCLFFSFPLLSLYWRSTQGQQSWLLDCESQDQFVIYQREQVSFIHWHGKPDQVGVARPRPVRSICGCGTKIID